MRVLNFILPLILIIGLVGAVNTGTTGIIGIDLIPSSSSSSGGAGGGHIGQLPYLYNDSDKMYFNDTELNLTIDDKISGVSGGNASWNQSLAYLLFSDIKWGYNQTLGAYNLWNNVWLSTYNATYALYNDTANLLTINTTGNIQNLLNSTGIYSTYNSTYASNLDTNCSDSSCVPVFYWANQSYLNETGLIILNNNSWLSTYNVTYASYQSNVSMNWSLLSNKTIYDQYNDVWLSTYNETYKNITSEWNGNRSYIVYLNQTNGGSINITDGFDTLKGIAVGDDALAKVDGNPSFHTNIFIQDNQSETDRGHQALRIDVKAKPTASGTIKTFDYAGIAGYQEIDSTFYNVSTGLFGLDFGTWFGGAARGGVNITTYGTRSFGAGGAFTGGTTNKTYGLYTWGFFDGFSGTINTQELYGLFVGDSPTGVTAKNHTVVAIQKPTTGTDKYQLMLYGSGAGSGIWFNSTNGPRIYSPNSSDLWVDLTGTFYVTNNISAKGYYDRSSEYDYLKYGEASQYLTDVSSRATVKDNTVEYNHEADPEFLQSSYGYSCNCKIVKVCKDVYKEFTNPVTGEVQKGTINECRNEENCDTCVGLQRDIGASVSWLRQSVYEQKVRIDTLEQENKLIKEEICKINPLSTLCK